jgi:hypothetical protein
VIRRSEAGCIGLDAVHDPPVFADIIVVTVMMVPRRHSRSQRGLDGPWRVRASANPRAATEGSAT